MKSPHPDPELGFALPPTPRVSKARVIALALLALAIVAGFFVLGWLPKKEAREALGATVAESSSRAVRVEFVHPKPVEVSRDLVLPGVVWPREKTTLYSRAEGFVQRWLVDIGDAVSEGQLLAEIDTPELGQQLAQAKAELARAEAMLAQARANRTLSQTQLGRYQKLAVDNSVASGDVDVRRAQASSDQAGVAASEATVLAEKAQIALLEERQSYGRITAPFAGTITRRAIDRGARVTAATELFDLAATDTVRVSVQVPQSVVPSVRVGLDATVNVREYAGQVFAGKVTRSSGSLDQVRTMQTQIEVPNPDGHLLPGMYCEVHLQLPTTRALVEIPSTALYSDAQGTRVGVVDADGKVRLVPVVIDRDTGATLQISSGITVADRVLKLASAGLVAGQTVEAVEPPPEPAKPAK